MKEGSNTGDAAMLDLARDLIAHEIAEGEITNADSAAARVTERLRRPISTLAGDTGFRSLLARALSLAKTHSLALGSVQVRSDGSLTGLERLSNGNADEVGAAVIAKLLELLMNFIGEALTLSLLQEGWPDWSPSKGHPHWNPNDLEE